MCSYLHLSSRSYLNYIRRYLKLNITLESLVCFLPFNSWPCRTFFAILTLNMSDPQYEFNASDADIVLLSSDLQPGRFHVHKNILSIASPVFRDMFSMPQPGKTGEGLAEVPMPDAEKVLDRLLRFIYPIPDPTIDTLEQLSAVLETAVKYQVEIVMSALQKILVSQTFLKDEPIRVWAIAARYSFEAEMKVAAKATLAVKLVGGGKQYAHELKYVDAYSYQHLLEFHDRTRTVAEESFGNVFQTGSNQNLCNYCPSKALYEKYKQKTLRSVVQFDVFTLEFFSEAQSGSDSGYQCLRCNQAFVGFKAFLDAKERMERAIENLYSVD